MLMYQLGIFILLLILLIVFVFLRVQYNVTGYNVTGYNVTEYDNIQIQKNYVKSLPIRPILIDDPVEEYRKNHPIIVSVTTSPKRISQIIHVFETLDLDSIDYIIVALPMKYGRDQSEYVIPDELQNFPKVKIIRIENDFGPITKLIPAVEYAKDELKTEDAIIITIDDDTAYPIGMIRELALHMILHSNTVVAGSGQNLNYWNIQSMFPQTDKNNALNTYTYNTNNYVDIVEGFGGVAYKPKYVDTELMKYLSEHKQCFVSDDMVISFVLAYSGVNRLKISNDYFSLENIKQYSYGFHEDALHRGAGIDNKNTMTIFENANHKKYKKCYQNLIDLTFDYNYSKFKKRQDIL